MLDSTYVSSLKDQVEGYDKMRQDVIKKAGSARHLSKQAIFAMHREEHEEAKKILKQAQDILSDLVQAHTTNARMQFEGSYREGLEEFVEATLLMQFIEDGKIGQIDELTISYDVYLAGLCDVPGELHRMAIAAATKRKQEELEKIHTGVTEIVALLSTFNFTKYLRTKADQARQAHKKVEYIMYEMSLRASE